MYSNLKKGNLKFQFDRNKEDAYALGLVMLEAGNGKSVQNIYDTKSGNVDQAALNKHLDDFNRKFGSQNALLTSHVSSLTNANENARPSPVQVQSALPPYDEVKKYLVPGASTSALPNSSILIPGDQSTTTHTIIQGGDTKTTVNQKVDMPDVNYDLFNMEIKDNPYLVQSQTETWDNSLANPTPKVMTMPSNQYVFKPNESNRNMTNSQVLVDQSEEQVHFAQPGQERQVKAEVPVNKENTLVYEETPDVWQSESLVNSNYIPSSYVPQKVYANAPVAVQTPTTYTTYNAPIESKVSYSQRNNSYLANPEIKHEYRLHNSTITQPEVISGGSYSNPSSISRPKSSRIIYTNPSPVNYTPSNSIVYQEAPVTTIYQTNSNQPSFSQQNVNNVYTEAPRSIVRYSQTAVYPETPKSTVSYTKKIGSTIYNESPVYEQRRSQVVYTQTPVTTYTTVNDPVYQSNYGSQSHVNVDGDLTYANRQYSYSGNPATVTTQVISNSGNIDVSGLKFVKSYSDNRFATERANY